ncbi:MAG: LacI family DNA-binding transcriptional regulator [Chthoniobacterales bacterium]|nr:LacI family DNA-binding transcriptional regulator [Chthoniobacterales bacterium]
MSPRVTLKRIAEKAGVHLSTVSLALRNHPSLPAGTRERLQSLAKEMGYRPDPMLASLVAYRTSTREASDHGVIAWVDAWRGAKSARAAYPELWTAAVARAASLGWRLEEFRMDQEGLTPVKLSRILRTRNITGVLIPPLQTQAGEMELEWPWFSAVATSHTLLWPPLHRVVPHQMRNMQLLLSELLSRSYKRPGLVIAAEVNERTRHYWRATFLDAQQALPKTRQLPVLLTNADEPDRLIGWFKRQRPDVIIASDVFTAREILQANGLDVPGDVGLAGVAFATEAWRPGGQAELDGSFPAYAGLAGIDERFGVIGESAIDTIVAMLHRNETGIPKVAKHIMIEGLWCDAPSIRRRE